MIRSPVLAGRLVTPRVAPAAVSRNVQRSVRGERSDHVLGAVRYSSAARESLGRAFGCGVTENGRLVALQLVTVIEAAPVK